MDEGENDVEIEVILKTVYKMNNIYRRQKLSYNIRLIFCIHVLGEVIDFEASFQKK